MDLFEHDAKCEKCKKGVATCFVFPQSDAAYLNCFFWCDDCQNETNPYWVGFEDYFNTAESITDWMAHLSGKRWFDSINFFEMMKRLRKETKSFGKTLKVR